MPKISISYRRLDSQDITGRIFDRLVQHYGRESVFRDIDNIRPGIDFRKQISEALQTTSVLLVIVGPRWFGRTKGGEGRIDNEADPVRIEVETALRRDIPVIPILVGGATMPRTTQLPESVKDFAFRHAVTVDSGVDFDSHLGRLLRDLDRMFVDDQSSKTPLQDTSKGAASAPPASPAPAAEVAAAARAQAPLVAPAIEAAVPAAGEAKIAAASAPAPAGGDGAKPAQAPENVATGRRRPRWVYASALLVVAGLLMAIIMNTSRPSDSILGVEAYLHVIVLAVLVAGCLIFLLAIPARKLVMAIRRRKRSPIESVIEGAAPDASQSSAAAASAPTASGEGRSHHDAKLSQAPESNATGRRLPRWVYAIVGILLIVVIADTYRPYDPIAGVPAGLVVWILVLFLVGYLLATPVRKLIVAVRRGGRG